MTNSPKKTGLFHRKQKEHDDVLDDLARAKVVLAGIGDDDAPADDTPPTPRKRGKPSVDDVLPRLVLDMALGPALKRRLKARGALAVVVQAPGPDWCAPLKRAAARLAARVYARTGSERSTDKPDVGNDFVSSSLRAGQNVFGISHAPDRYLPSTLTTVADARVVAKAPDGSMVRSLLSRCVGPAPKDVSDSVAAGLGYHDIVSCFRSGATPAQVLAHLAAASSAKTRVSSTDDTPPLDRLSGYVEAKAWAMDLKDGLDSWKCGALPFKSLSSACVLHGPPGVGKSLFARSLARTLGVPIVVTSVGDWFATTSGNLDSVIKGAQAAFDAARALAAPAAILFIDELDALPDRRRLSDRGRDWWLPVCNYLLLLTDSASTARDGICLVGASNFPENLDPALVRPGRFDRLIRIPPPDPDGIAGIVRFHLGSAAPDADPAALAKLARLAPGATGADAAQWVRDAKQLARQAGRDVTLDDLVAVVTPEDSTSPDDRRFLAVHEAGHAVAGVLAGRALRSISVVARADSGGRTTMSAGPSGVLTRATIDVEIQVLVSGRAAEEVLMGAASMGAEADLAIATRILAAMHASGGLGADLLHRAPSCDAHTLLALDPKLRAAVADDLARVYAGAVAMVRRNRAAVEALADALIDKRFLDGAEAEAIVRKALASPRRRGPKRRTP